MLFKIDALREFMTTFLYELRRVEHAAAVEDVPEETTS